MFNDRLGARDLNTEPFSLYVGVRVKFPGFGSWVPDLSATPDLESNCELFVRRFVILGVIFRLTCELNSETLQLRLSSSEARIFRGRIFFGLGIIRSIL